MMSSTQNRFSMFPAVLIAGVPNSGKSVLSYLLSRHLRQFNIAHYLLRAAPDGEGDWFLQNGSEDAATLRKQHKRAYSPEFVAEMRQAIEYRRVPLLVDVGGLPRGEQFGILRACTHAILLYRTEEEKATWQNTLQELGVPLIALLRSGRDEPPQIEQTYPMLQGVITGLDRAKPQSDLTFGALLERVAGLCRYDEVQLESIHLRLAAYPLLLERVLLAHLHPQVAGIWQPDHLPQLTALTALPPPGGSFSLYGRGPVWLAAFLALRALPASIEIFDIRYGWLPLPQVHPNSAQPVLNLVPESSSVGLRLNFQIPKDGILHSSQLRLPPLEIDPNLPLLILSGKLPRWAYAALAQHFAQQTPALAITDMNKNYAVVVASRTPQYTVGGVVLM